LKKVDYLLRDRDSFEEFAVRNEGCAFTLGQKRQPRYVGYS